MAKLPSVCMALPMLLLPSGAQSHGQERLTQHLTLTSTIGDLLAHPAFHGHARLLLPWDEQADDLAMPLSQIGRLLPYHSQVHPAEAINGLNRLIDEVNQGRQVFYDIYTHEQQQADPDKQHTGLFLFRGNPGAPFALIAPGGGFAYVGALHEGLPYAMAISQAGYNALVLKYRVGQGGRVATEDLAAALGFIHRHARTLGVDSAHYSLWGSSAGARMAASVGSYGTQAFGGEPLPKPETVVMAYTGHSDHQSVEPPTFVVVGEQDGIASPAVMARRVAQLRQSGTEVEFHRYPGVGHGFGLGTGTSAAGWVQRAIRFWGQHIHSSAPQPPAVLKKCEL